MRLDTSASSGHHRTWRALLAVALAAVMCVAVAACGGDDSDSGNAGTAGTSGGSGGESLGDATVGILVPLTGELGDFGKSWEQAREPGPRPDQRNRHGRQRRDLQPGAVVVPQRGGQAARERQGVRGEVRNAPGLLVANSYDAMMLVGLAMVKAGSTDGEAINGALRDVANPEGVKVSTFAEGVEALEAGEDVDYEGASGPVDFDDSGTVSSSYTILEVKDGKYGQKEFYPAEDFTGAAAE